MDMGKHGVRNAGRFSRTHEMKHLNKFSARSRGLRRLSVGLCALSETHSQCTVQSFPSDRGPAELSCAEASGNISKWTIWHRKPWFVILRSAARPRLGIDDRGARGYGSQVRWIAKIRWPDRSLRKHAHILASIK